MLSARLIVAVVTCALSVTSTTGSSIHVRIHNRHHEAKAEADCPDTQKVSVVSWPDPVCVDGQMCVASYSAGACPDGAVCAPVAYSSSGDAVFGCVPDDLYCDDTEDPSDDDCTGDDETPMSVVGWTHVSCVSGQACVATYSDGACPENAVCALVTYDASNKPVYGCYATNTTSSAPAPAPAPAPGPVQVPAPAPVPASGSTCASDEQSIGVQGWNHDGCVPKSANVCVASRSDGVCPDGAKCAVVSSSGGKDVYGCKAVRRHHRKHHVTKEDENALRRRLQQAKPSA